MTAWMQAGQLTWVRPANDTRPMPRIRFTPNLHRHTPCEDAETGGDTVAAALDEYFARRPGVRGYLLDDQGAVRHHMVIFVNGEPLRDRAALSDEVAADAEIFVFQALSGG